MARERVLIVDDDPITRNFVQNLLVERGYEADTANDGNEALRYILQNPPDLVLTDLIMPGRDGFQLLHDIKSHPKLERIPVIVLSVRNQEQDIVRGLELGAADYMVKPFHALELLVRISRALEHQTGIENGGRSS